MSTERYSARKFSRGLYGLATIAFCVSLLLNFTDDLFTVKLVISLIGYILSGAIYLLAEALKRGDKSIRERLSAAENRITALERQGEGE